MLKPNKQLKQNSHKQPQPAKSKLNNPLINKHKQLKQIIPPSKHKCPKHTIQQNKQHKTNQNNTHNKQ